MFVFESACCVVVLVLLHELLGINLYMPLQKNSVQNKCSFLLQVPERHLGHVNKTDDANNHARAHDPSFSYSALSSTLLRERSLFGSLALGFIFSQLPDNHRSLSRAVVVLLARLKARAHTNSQVLAIVGKGQRRDAVGRLLVLL